MFHAVNVTTQNGLLSDTQNLPAGTDYVSFSNSGAQTITVTPLGTQGSPDDAPVTITGLSGGWMHRLRVKKIWATGTTVTNIVAYWH